LYITFYNVELTFDHIANLVFQCNITITNVFTIHIFLIWVRQIQHFKSVAQLASSNIRFQ